MSGFRPDLRRAATYVLSTVSGALCSGAVMALCAWVMYELSLPIEFAGFLALFSLGAGCMLSGFICGRIKKRGGLHCGFICAVVMLSLCILVSLVRGTVTGPDAIAKTVTAVLTGCAGGVLGVNVSR